MKSSQKRALVFGGYGQAGRFLIPLLESKGYRVLAPFHSEVDITTITLQQCLLSYMPDEVYNLAAVMPLNIWEDSVNSMLVNTVAVRSMLSILFNSNPKAKFFQASSASVFGDTFAPQSETSIKRPTTTYGVSKLAAQELVRVYRNNGFFACTGIFFNMESQFRHPRHFSRTVILGIAKIIKEIQNGVDPQPLRLGNLNAIRDWGLTSEYMEAAYEIMQADEPDEYVVGTGISAPCLEFVEYAFYYAKLDYSLFKYKLPELTGRSDVMTADPAKIFDRLRWKAKTSYKGVIANLLAAVLDKEYVQSLIAR